MFKLSRDDLNFEQGKELLNNNNNNNKNLAKNLSLMEQTTGPELASIISVLQNNESVQAMHTVKIRDLSKLEERYNSALAEYTQNYKLLMDEAVNHQTSNSQHNVKYKDSYYYINNYGYIHRYSDDAWQRKSKKCNLDLITINETIFNSLIKGPDIGIGQACNIAGKNIENRETKERAWVDIKGYKHVYHEEIWGKRNKSCSASPIIISNDSYINIPTGSVMAEEIPCNKISIDPNSPLWKNLVLLNNKLIILAKQLLQNTDDLVINDKNISTQLGSLKDGINIHITNLENDKKKLNDVQESFSIESILTNRFLSLVIFCIIVVIFLLYFSFINNTRVLYIILLILIIVLLYKIVKYFINHIY